jgi:hypothetical protein
MPASIYDAHQCPHLFAFCTLYNKMLNVPTGGFNVYVRAGLKNQTERVEKLKVLQ